MNITKSIAENVAIAMTKQKQDEITKVGREMADIVQDYVVKCLPKEVKSFYKSHPKWVNKSSFFVVRGVGIGYYINQETDELPIQNHDKIVVLPDSEAVKYMALFNRKKDLKDEVSALVADIKNALLTMRTYKRIEEQWPEAFALIPKDEAKKPTGVAINLSDIKKRLK